MQIKELKQINYWANATPTTALMATSAAFADFEDWQIEEFFTNADGTIQYIELSTVATAQDDLDGVSLEFISIAGNSTFEFDRDLEGDTANRSLLLATAGFEVVAGLAPDFVLPDGFMSIGGGILDYANGEDTVTYTAAQLPINGEQALNDALSPIVPSPTNYAGEGGAILSIPVDAAFNATSSVLNLPVLDVPGIGVANVSFDVDLDAVEFVLRDDFYLFGNGIEAGSSAAVLQGDGVLYIPRLPVGNDLFEFNLQLVSEDPVTFANPAILSVGNIPAEPEPGPTALEQSISRGQVQFAGQCTDCHGNSGTGGIGPNLTISNLNTFDALRSYINSNMPQAGFGFGRSPSDCTDTSSTCATDVANYIINVLQ